jgi:hypothetical protein
MAALSPTGVPDREALREFVRTYRASGASRGNPAGATDAGCIVEVTATPAPETANRSRLADIGATTLTAATARTMC